MRGGKRGGVVVVTQKNTWVRVIFSHDCRLFAQHMCRYADLINVIYFSIVLELTVLCDNNEKMVS